jgi:hypothetical protein
MSKLEELKNAMANPPPQRLAKIEYQSHFLSIIGVMFVCIVLLSRGFWYIIFAFVFSLGVSYSQGMSAYTKYRNIMSIVEPERAEEFEEDKSPTRRISKIVNYIFGTHTSKVVTLLSVIITVFVIDPTISRWLLMPVYLITIIFLYIVIYFLILYWIAYPIYKKKIRREKQ